MVIAFRGNVQMLIRSPARPNSTGRISLKPRVAVAKNAIGDVVIDFSIRNFCRRAAG
jgi:hypothetical protein